MWLDIRVLYQLSLIQFKTHKLSNRHVLTLQIFLQHNSNTMWSEQTVAWYTSSGASAILLTPHLKHTQTIKQWRYLKITVHHTGTSKNKNKLDIGNSNICTQHIFINGYISVRNMWTPSGSSREIGHPPITTGRHLHHWAALHHRKWIISSIKDIHLPNIYVYKI